MQLFLNFNMRNLNRFIIVSANINVPLIPHLLSLYPTRHQQSERQNISLLSVCRVNNIYSLVKAPQKLMVSSLHCVRLNNFLSSFN